MTPTCLALFLTGLTLVSACSENSASQKPDQPQPGMGGAVPVTVGTVSQKTVPVELRVIGTGEAYSTVSIKPQIGGQLTRVSFREGQDVKKGELLFSIDPRPLEAALKQAEANLARDTAQSKNAEEQARRYADLVKRGIATEEQYDHFRTNAEALQAAIRADGAALENAKVQLDYSSIHAPTDGRTGSLIVHEGNVVKANETTLVVVNQINPIYVNFSVPEQYLAEIKKYMAARKVGVDAIIPRDEDHPEHGLLTFVDNAVDSGTGTVRLKGTFANPHRRLWPGQFVNVVLTLTSQPDAIVVPSQAVQTGQSGQYVFVVKPDLTVESRPVVTARTIDGETVVEKGLQPGERVVTDGQLRLVPGAKVELKNTPRTRG